MYIVGVRMWAKALEGFQPEALRGQVSCKGGMGTKQVTERAHERSATDKHVPARGYGGWVQNEEQARHSM